MTRDQAKRKYDALLNMTAARGCTPHEAATAQRLAAQLAKRFGFAYTPPQHEYKPDFDQRYQRAEQRAAARWHWEYRRCGKDNCWCYASSGKAHGPYKYSKKREGRRVRSIYVGR